MFDSTITVLCGTDDNKRQERVSSVQHGTKDNGRIEQQPSEAEEKITAMETADRQTNTVSQTSQTVQQEENAAPEKEMEPLTSIVRADLLEEPQKQTGASVKNLSDKDVTDYTSNLWKYLPVSENEPEAAPEYMSLYRELDDWCITAARVRGKKHKHEGTNCDDWYEVANVGNIIIIAVSDGAGSKKFSRIGAKESCRAAVGYLVSEFSALIKNDPEFLETISLPLGDKKCIDACSIAASILQQAVLKGRDAVEAAFYSRSFIPEFSQLLQRPIDLKDFSSTLLLTVIIPLSNEERESLVINCQVGDGMVAVLHGNGSFENAQKLMGDPDSGEFSGETDFLTSSRMKESAVLKSRTKLYRGIIDTVVSMTDGVSDDYFPNETQLRRLYLDLILNGIIEDRDKSASLSSFSEQQMHIFKKIPAPIRYSWVNDRNVIVPIQYTSRICDALGIDLGELWENRSILMLAKLELADAIANESKAERLKVWLDNYYNRGSFDDRTLVIVEMQEVTSVG